MLFACLPGLAPPAKVWRSVRIAARRRAWCGLFEGGALCLTTEFRAWDEAHNAFPYPRFCVCRLLAAATRWTDSLNRTHFSCVLPHLQISRWRRFPSGALPAGGDEGRVHAVRDLFPATIKWRREPPQPRLPWPSLQLLSALDVHNLSRL